VAPRKRRGCDGGKRAGGCIRSDQRTPWSETDRSDRRALTDPNRNDPSLLGLQAGGQQDGEKQADGRQNPAGDGTGGTNNAPGDQGDIDPLPASAPPQTQFVLLEEFD